MGSDAIAREWTSSGPSKMVPSSSSRRRARRDETRRDDDDGTMTTVMTRLEQRRTFDRRVTDDGGRSSCRARASTVKVDARRAVVGMDGDGGASARVQV